MKDDNCFKGLFNKCRCRDVGFGSREHERKVFQNTYCSKEDVEELGSFLTRFNELNKRHKEWFGSLTECRPKNYRDVEIGECSEEKYITSIQLHSDWLNLKQDIEQFLEKKGFPLKYEERAWNGLIVGVESVSIDYNGDYTKTGFDPGPANRCAVMLTGALSEMFSRRRLQRIELYTKCGLFVGSLGLFISLISIVIWI